MLNTMPYFNPLQKNSKDDNVKRIKRRITNRR